MGTPAKFQGKPDNLGVFAGVRLPESPGLGPSGHGGNAEGIHPIDLHVQRDGSCRAAADGWRKVRDIGWKY